MYLTLNELASMINKTKRQIRYMIDNDIAYPINPDTYRSDGGYRFSKEEAERLQAMYASDDKLSLNEAAEIAGISAQYLSRLAKDDYVESELVTIGQHQERKFTPENIKQLQERLNERKGNRQTDFGLKLILFANGVRLFDVLEYKGKKARVVRTKPINLLLEDGQIVAENELPINSERWPEKTYVRKKGLVDFKISIPRNLDHQTYDTLYKMIDQLGERNIQVYETKTGDYYVRCRQGNFFGSEDDFELLKVNLKAGKVQYRGHRIYIDTNFVSKTINIPDGLFERIKLSAEAEKVSVEEKIISTLEDQT